MNDGTSTDSTTTKSELLGKATTLEAGAVIYTTSVAGIKTGELKLGGTETTLGTLITDDDAVTIIADEAILIITDDSTASGNAEYSTTTTLENDGTSTIDEAGILVNVATTETGTKTGELNDETT